MNQHLTRTQRSIAAVVLPSLLMLVVFVLGFYMPLQRTSQEESAKLKKLLAITRKFDIQAETSEREQLEIQLQTVSRELEQSQATYGHLIASHKALNDGDDSQGGQAASTPTQVLARMVLVLERHGLQCLGTELLSQPVASRGQSGQTAATTNLRNSMQNFNRCEMLLNLRGTFTQVRSAINELKESSFSPMLDGLEMAVADELSTERGWKLKVKF